MPIPKTGKACCPAEETIQGLVDQADAIEMLTVPPSGMGNLVMKGRKAILQLNIAELEGIIVVNGTAYNATILCRLSGPAT